MHSQISNCSVDFERNRLLYDCCIEIRWRSVMKISSKMFCHNWNWQGIGSLSAQCISSWSPSMNQHFGNIKTKLLTRYSINMQFTHWKCYIAKRFIGDVDTQNKICFQSRYLCPALLACDVSSYHFRDPRLCKRSEIFVSNWLTTTIRRIPFYCTHQYA